MEMEMNVELQFYKENYVKYGTKKVIIKKAKIFLSEDKVKEFCIFLNIDETKYGYRKATVQLDNPDICLLIKSWETQVNKYLKD